MSANRQTLRSGVLLGLIACAGLASADEEELPDLEFLEYLGSWEESDEDWLLFREFAAEPAATDTSEETDTETADTQAAKKATESE